jgi:uncharacterized membrane protein YgcG
MKRTFLLSLSALLLFAATMPPLASADSSHVRIVRLSLVEGDVRYAREFHNDPVTDSKAVWETAPLNLPIRQGNVLSTGNGGRAEVEFENGAMAFLNANTILEFYDLSLNDGSRVTRLILRQGSASFYDHSPNGDYFSVTGGDFSVEVTGQAAFHLENFDNGSTVTVQSGRVSVLQNDNSTPLEKGHSLSVQASNPTSQVVTQAAPGDDFDRWVSSRIQNEQLVSSQPTPGVGSATYVPGYSSLYTYGSWLNIGGITCWRPFGLGWAWNPFNDGNWIYDASIGWSFIGYAPWGWLPYHYGGWNFFPGYGWAWNPGNTFYGRPQPYRPVTAVFVKSGNTVGLVPMNVADKSGKTPLNLGQGVFPLENGTIGKPVTPVSTEKWSVVKAPQSTVLSARTATVAPPAHVSRTIAPTTLSTRETSFGRNSSIVYDANEHRFVNSTQARITEASAAVPANELKTVGKNPMPNPAMPKTNVPAATRAPAIPTSTRVSSAMPPRPPAAPAPARVGGSGSSWGGSSWGSASGGSTGGSSRSSGSSSGSSSHPSSSGGGGGKPH